MDKLGDIHDHSKCHFFENMNSGNVGRLSTYCTTIVNMGLDISFVKCYSCLLRQIFLNSSQKCNVSNNSFRCFINIIFPCEVLVNFETQKLFRIHILKL